MHANDAKTFLKHFSDCLFYFCSTYADSIIAVPSQPYWIRHRFIMPFITTKTNGNNEANTLSEQQMHNGTIADGQPAQSTAYDSVSIVRRFDGPKVR